MLPAPPFPNNLYNNTRMVKIVHKPPTPKLAGAHQPQACFFITVSKINDARKPLHRESRTNYPRQVFWLRSAARHLPTPQRGQWFVAWLHNGTHSCGTVGDLHPCSLFNRVVANLFDCKNNNNLSKSKEKSAFFEKNFAVSLKLSNFAPK